MRHFLVAIIVTVALGAVQADAGRAAAIESAVSAGNWKQAIKLAEDWVDASPNVARAHFWLARSLRTKMEEVSKLRALGSVGDYKDALARAIELDPNLVDARTERIGYLIHAPGIAGGDRDQAVEEIAALKATHPVEAAQMAIDLAGARDDPDGMLAAARELQALQPETAAHRLRLGQVLITREQYDEADELLSAAADSDEPGVALGAQYQRARWRILAGREHAVAIELLTQYLDQRGDGELPWSPDRAAAFWRLGLAQEQAGDLGAALASLQTSVELNEDYGPAKKDLKRVRRLNSRR